MLARMTIRHTCRAAALALIALIALSAPPAAVAGDAVGLIASADLVTGARLFLRCKACHTIDRGGRHRLGPNLRDVIGRKKASAPGFRYSPALKRLGGIWSYDALDGYIESPKTFAPGNRMAFPGLKDPSQRAAVIAYLRTLSHTPPPLPEAAARAAPPAQTASAEEDFSGLPPGTGREEVHAICNACHSLRLVVQQGLDADRWDDLLDWMTEKQGMPALAGDERRRIVAYLAEFYGPDRKAARPSDRMRPAMPSMPMMTPAMPPQP